MFETTLQEEGGVTTLSRAVFMETGQNGEVIDGRESRVLKSFVKFHHSVLRSYLWWVSLGTFDNTTKYLVKNNSPI